MAKRDQINVRISDNTRSELNELKKLRGDSINITKLFEITVHNELIMARLEAERNKNR